MVHPIVHPAKAEAPPLKYFDGMSSTTYETWKGHQGEGPRVENGSLRLLTGVADESNGVLLKGGALNRVRRLEVRWEMRLLGAEGAALALLDAEHFRAADSLKQFREWDEPNLPSAFAVAFDTLNPKETNAFNANGNIYDRPERELSLHSNAVEVANRLSSEEFRAASANSDFVPVRVLIEWVTGGAVVSVWVREVAVYERYLVPGLSPFAARIAFGARSSNAGGLCDLRNVSVSYGTVAPPAAPPLRVNAFDRQLINILRQQQAGTVEFPADNERFGRIIARLTLAEPSAGLDPWDRIGAVYLYDESGQRFEVMRFITPYKRAGVWEVDVSDFRPLLRGKKRLEVWCITYGPGWLVSLDFNFYPGPARRYATRVVNLWNGQVEIGNPQNPSSQFWKPREITRPRDADAVALRFMVTGHGMSPNSKNAAEFMPSTRFVTVGPRRYENLLWKTDNYLNPLRPQSGTWKYDRAGWAPGSVVDPWVLDISNDIPRGARTSVTYDIEPYVNENIGKARAPFYQFEAVVIFYRNARLQ